MMFPKPAKPVRGTRAAREWLGKVAQLACVCCSRRPVAVHHCIHGRHSQGRSSDFETIPLCPTHHRQLHDDRLGWIARYGLDTDWLDEVRRLIAENDARTV